MGKVTSHSYKRMGVEYNQPWVMSESNAWVKGKFEWPLWAVFTCSFWSNKGVENIGA